MLFKCNVGILNGTQTAEVVIRVLQLSGRIRHANLKESVFTQHLRSQMQPMVIGPALVVDSGNGISFMLLLKSQRKIYPVLFFILTGSIGYILLMESIVTLILQILRNVATFLRQCLHTELHTWM